MALSEKRAGEIALLALQTKLEESGEIRLNPKEIKREITNASNRLGISHQECAEFFLILMKPAYDKCMAEIAKMTKGKVEE